MHDLNWFQSITGHFCLDGALKGAQPFGTGHINDTYRLAVEADGRERPFILQKMNQHVFRNIPELMENIVRVTAFLRDKITAQGGDPDRETLRFLPCRDGSYFYRDEQGDCWRICGLIENATSYDLVQKPEDFYESGLAFGNFQRLLADFPAHTLHETIPDFHNTPVRLEQFKAALSRDTLGRAALVQPEIDFVLQHAEDTHILTDLQAQGKLPLRVTHNDTKLNNIMIDNATGKAICIIDLDTVMPGLVLNDFGDSIRFGASTALEDETDLSKVSCDMNLFEVYTKGFIQGCCGSLTKTELDMLPTGAKLMTLECGMRFLADYLDGDVYFKSGWDGHNLARARTQFRLVQDMESKWDIMHQIVDKYR